MLLAVNASEIVDESISVNTVDVTSVSVTDDVISEVNVDSVEESVGRAVLRLSLMVVIADEAISVNGAVVVVVLVVVADDFFREGILRDVNTCDDRVDDLLE